ncbi:MAG: DUF3008 family protein, partial [Lutibacter sp.]
MKLSEVAIKGKYKLYAYFENSDHVGIKVGNDLNELIQMAMQHQSIRFEIFKNTDIYDFGDKAENLIVWFDGTDEGRWADLATFDPEIAKKKLPILTSKMVHTPFGGYSLNEINSKATKKMKLKSLVDEKAVSKKQQKFFGMVHAAQKGEKPASPKVAKVAKSISKSDAEDFASTKHKGLPEKVTEGFSENFAVGQKIKIADLSGVDSNKTGTIVSPKEVKTNGQGVPTNIQGAYKPVDWNKEAAVRLDDGELITMFKNRLSPVANTLEEKWDIDVEIKNTGENTKQSVGELKAQLNNLKKKSEKYQDKDKPVPEDIKKKEHQKNFAIRAK